MTGDTCWAEKAPHSFHAWSPTALCWPVAATRKPAATAASSKHQTDGQAGKNLLEPDSPVNQSHPSPHTCARFESMVQSIYTFWHSVTAELF